jgi:hypothetical protein
MHRDALELFLQKQNCFPAKALLKCTGSLRTWKLLALVFPMSKIIPSSPRVLQEEGSLKIIKYRFLSMSENSSFKCTFQLSE